MSESAAPPSQQENGVAVPDKLCNLPPCQPIALKLLQLSADDDCEVRDLTSVLQAEPAISTEILRLANSPLFGAISRFHSVSNAVVFLGLARTKSLAFTVAMKSYMHNSTGAPALRQCWLHSLACAQIAEEICAPYGIRKDWAYSAGLMHDIGRLGLVKAYGPEYIPVLGQEFETIPESLEEERRLFGFDHCKAGAWLARVWNFPEELSVTTECHHEPYADGQQELLSVIQLACRLADALDFAAITCKQRPSFAEVLEQLPPDRRSAFAFEPEELKEKITQRLQSLQ